MIVELVINLLFLVEMIVDILLHTSIKAAYSCKFRLWPETLCQIINIFTMIDFFQNVNNSQAYNQISKLFELIIFIRVVKIVTLIYEIRVLRLIVETMRNLVSPIKNLFIITLVIFYLFSVIGSFFFGGKVTVYSPEILSDLSIP